MSNSLPNGNWKEKAYLRIASCLVSAVEYIEQRFDFFHLELALSVFFLTVPILLFNQFIWLAVMIIALVLCSTLFSLGITVKFHASKDLLKNGSASPLEATEIANKQSSAIQKSINAIACIAGAIFLSLTVQRTIGL